MKNLQLLLIFLFAINAKSADTLIVKQSLYYENDLFQLSTNHENELKRILKEIPNYNQCKIYIHGNTDVNGTDDYNKALSKKRANEVASFFEKNSIASKDIHKDFFGEKFAIDESKNDANYKYRRVDVEALLIRFTNIGELFSSTAAGLAQIETIDANKDNFIKGKNGTELIIPKNSFVFADGSLCNGTVAVELKEAVDVFSIFTNGLSTTSEGNPLATRGMVYVAATQEGKELSLADGKKINITLPSKKFSSEDMNVFYGEKSTDGSINWVVDNQNNFNRKNDKTPIVYDTIDVTKIKIPSYSKPEIPVFANEIKYPIRPIAPRVPTEPVKPQPSQHLYIPSATEKVFLSKKQIEKKSAEKYNTVLYQYNKRLERYNKNKERYNRLTIEYKKSFAQYVNESLAYEKKLTENKKEAQRYINLYERYFVCQQAQAIKDTLARRPIIRKNVLNYLLSTSGNYIALKTLYKELKKDSTYLHLLKFVSTEEKREIRNIDITWGRNWRFNNNSYRLFDSIFIASGLKEDISTLRTNEIKKLEKQSSLQTYLFDGFVADIGQLGWINCDKFYNVPESQKTIASIEESDDAAIYLIQQKDGLILKLYKNNGKYTSGPIPKDENYKLVAVKMNEGKIFIATKEIEKISPTPITLDYQFSNLDALENELKKITAI